MVVEMHYIATESEMKSLPVVRPRLANYENIEVECPHCGRENIFNRRTDLGTVEPVTGEDLACLVGECRQRFRLVGDAVNNPHEMMLFDCELMIERKRYMNCVLSVGQAYEVFFSLFFRIELAFKPCAVDPNNHASDLNRLLALLSARTLNDGFKKLRATVALMVAEGRSLSNVAEAEAAIGSLGADVFRRLERVNLASMADREKGDLLRKLMAVDINDMRNSIVHKQAYRPTFQEARTAVDEARGILHPLTRVLGLYDDPNWYLRSP
jgi:hypothetical protein